MFSPRKIKAAAYGMRRVLFYALLKHRLPGADIPVQRNPSGAETDVDAYWNRHTVFAPGFTSAAESEKYLRWRGEQYPLFEDFMELYGDHEGETVLDYGCGPGNDLTGYALHSRAARIIGIDVSATALDKASRRLSLHGIPPARVSLIQVGDAGPEIPLENESVDHIYCQGVLHHTRHPGELLSEFHRVLKPGRRACIMVYNPDSVWLHLYVAWVKIVRENAYPGMDACEAFHRTTDGEDCPVARPCAPAAFMALCEEAGFDTAFRGGYLSLHELELLRKYRARAMRDERLARPHRDFLAGLAFDDRGYPMHAGKHAGIGGVYVAVKT